MGNSVEKEKQLTLYYNAVNKKDYGVMYAKYNVILFAENEENRLKVIEIAKQEVEERPNAQSYDLLAWAYFRNNNKTKALEIVEKYLDKGSSVYVEGKLQTRKWQDKSGADRWTTEIVGSELTMLGSRQTNSSNDMAANQSESPFPQDEGGQGLTDDDIPF